MSFNITEYRQMLAKLIRAGPTLPHNIADSHEKTHTLADVLVEYCAELRMSLAMIDDRKKVADILHTIDMCEKAVRQIRDKTAAKLDVETDRVFAEID